MSFRSSTAAATNAEHAPAAVAASSSLRPNFTFEMRDLERPSSFYHVVSYGYDFDVEKIFLVLDSPNNRAFISKLQLFLDDMSALVYFHNRIDQPLLGTAAFEAAHIYAWFAFVNHRLILADVETQDVAKFRELERLQPRDFGISQHDVSLVTKERAAFIEEALRSDFFISSMKERGHECNTVLSTMILKSCVNVSCIFL
jgi:hypothetical protein